MTTLAKTTALALAAALLASQAAAQDLSTVQKVNTEVNAARAWGSPLNSWDAWASDPDGDGVYDCENFAADKVAQLRTLGIPARVVKGKDARGARHAVAIADGLYLDSQYQTVFTVKEARRLRLFTPDGGW